jgi:hypothetical protein
MVNRSFTESWDKRMEVSLDAQPNGRLVKEARTSRVKKQKAAEYAVRSVPGHIIEAGGTPAQARAIARVMKLLLVKEREAKAKAREALSAVGFGREQVNAVLARIEQSFSSRAAR